MKRPQCIRDLMTENGENYILPFLWLKGEDRKALVEEIERIEDCQIKAFCVESRPHPDFLGSTWWEDMDTIIETAKEKNMKVWLLDDEHFPTGYANGAFKKNPEKAKIYLKEFHMDLLGPVKETTVILESIMKESEELLGIWLYRRSDPDSSSLESGWYKDLTEKRYDGTVSFSLPAGSFRLFTLYTTHTGGGKEDYMNLIDRESVQILIKTVYEPHYQRYRNEFGKTFAGFFSDEPELGNTAGFDFDARLGKPSMALPWSRELANRLKCIWGESYVKYLPLLWYEAGDKTSSIRYEYMNQVTLLVKECLAEQLGAWCRERGVQYIGHVIEDNNAHGRMGCSTGHYFRTQAGQDMSGIDVVSLQIMPGFTGKIHRWVADDSDAEFFQFGLAKLGSSCAAIDPGKKGNAMCEIFGAYGWGEGISLMKRLIDHMVVNGINVFVPHAFSMTYPDADCPPHFYAGGQNPQYRFFRKLMRYLNRLCHIFHEGERRVEAAVVYHAEAEWSGGETMLFQKPVRELTERQIDCDVIPIDLLMGGAVFSNNGMWINKRKYRALIIPYCEKIPDQLAELVQDASVSHVPVYIIDAVPETLVSGGTLPAEFEKWVTVVPLKEIAGKIADTDICAIQTETECRELRACCYERQDCTVYFFVNESRYERIETEITLNGCGEQELMVYDCLENSCYPVRDAKKPMTAVPVLRKHGKKEAFWLCLEPGEALLCFSAAGEQAERTPVMPAYQEKIIPIDTNWTVSCSEGGKKFTKCLELMRGETLPNLNGPHFFPRFCGTYRYEGSFYLSDQMLLGKRFILEFPLISECAEVFVNNCFVGDLLKNGHYLEAANCLKAGENRLRIEMTNTLAWKLHDRKSSFMQLEATGLGEVPILYICNTDDKFMEECICRFI